MASMHALSFLNFDVAFPCDVELLWSRFAFSFRVVTMLFTMQ